MGIELLVLGVSLAITAATAAFLIMSAPKGQQDSMQPQSLDQFNITQAREGSVVPLAYGRSKITGNIIWYDNLTTEEVTQEVEGGKGGGGSEEQTVGFRYFLDIWQSLCHGKVTVISTYIQNDLKTVEAANTIYNDGTQLTYPTQPGAHATPNKGVAHIFYEKMFLGENVSTVPTIHFVVDRDLSGLPIVYANMANGNNPAAIIYDIMIRGGVKSNEIDVASFNAAATFWNSKGYGLNIVFSSQKKVSDMIADVLNYVDGSVFVTQLGQFALKAYNPDDQPAETMDDDDFIDISFSRPSYSQMPNSFTANYVDAEQDFTQRTLTLKNEANLLLTGDQINQSLDFTGFRDAEAASKRLYEFMKNSSYPALEIAVKTSLAFSELKPGDIVSINSTDFGITSGEFRVVSIDNEGIDSNEISFKGIQVTETLFDDVFLIAGEPEFTSPGIDLQVFTDVRAFELPYSKITEFEPAFLLLVARKTYAETAFSVMWSLESGANYITKGAFTTFSQVGTLQSQYPSNTYAIDDTVGILYTPTKFDPSFGPISRGQLFTTMRVAVIGNEIIAFQDVQPEGVGNYRLTGCVRGVLGTPIETHNVGAKIYLTSLANNILRGVTAGNFYIKAIPRFHTQSVDPGLVSPVSVSLTNKAKTPRKVSRLLATRTGDSVVLEIFPSSPDVPGFGDGNADQITDAQPHPFFFGGDFELSYNSLLEYIQNTTKTITLAGAFVITVKQRRFGFLSESLAITVGSGDGQYVASS